MRKYISVVFILITLCTTCTTLEGITVSPWISYTNLNMSEVNSWYEDVMMHSIVVPIGWNLELTKFSNAYIAGIDFGILRIASLRADPLKIIINTPTESINPFIIQTSVDMALIKLIRLKLSKSNYVFEFYTGYALASINNSYPGDGVPEPIVFSCYGSDFTCEAVIKSKISKNIEFNVSYRYLIIRNIFLTENVDVDNDGIPDYIEGDELNFNEFGEPFDYGGLTISLGIRFGPRIIETLEEK